MSNQIMCKRLCVLQKMDCGLMRGPIDCSFFSTAENIFIEIHQLGIREIAIYSSEEKDPHNLWLAFKCVTEFLMLFDGWFLPISTMEFSESESSSKEELAQCADYYKKHILSGYTTTLNFRGRRNSIADFECFDIASLYDRWYDLRNELDIVHIMFFCQCSDTGLPVDIVCANIIQCFEPLSELIEQKVPTFKVAQIEGKGKTLKSCLDAVITNYGQDIFKVELSHDKNEFLSQLVNTRVRIMHIRNNMRGKKCLNGDDPTKYEIKLQWLYRRVILDLIVAKFDVYKSQLEELVERIDCGLKWY